MSVQFLTIASQQSLHALSVVLRTEGVSFQKGLGKGNLGATLIDVDEIDRDFKPTPGSSLFISPSPQRNWEQVKELSEGIFGVTCKRIVSARKGNLRLKDRPIFREIITTLHTFGFSEVSIPLNNIVECEVGSNAEVLAEIEVKGVLFPAVILKDGHFLTTFDLGGSLLSLLTETYFEREGEKKPLSPIANFVYKIIPYRLRLMIYSRFLKRVRSELSKAPHFTTETPVDPAGWTLCQIFINALDHSLDFTPRIWKWPDNYSYAFCFTHDIEPRKFAYYRGLPELLDTLGELDLKSTISIVAEPPFVLPEDTARRLPEAGHEVISHGLHHDGTFNIISSGERASQIRKSRKKLEELVGTEVRGFRAPWLQRTIDLGELLESESILFDSSFVDADTSLKKAWHGKGISFNFPFKLFKDENGIKEYQVLELPLTGPQDMEPCFAGLSLDRCKAVFKQKHDWIRAIGGLDVFLAHAGVYGERDLEMRMALLRYLHKLIEGEDVWITKLGEVSEWWLSREGLKIISLRMADPGEVLFEVENQGNQKVSNFSLAIPAKVKVNKIYVGDKMVRVIKGNKCFFVPIMALEPGEKVPIKLFGEMG